jgi:hypothetical protein
MADVTAYTYHMRGMRCRCLPIAIECRCAALGQSEAVVNTTHIVCDVNVRVCPGRELLAS